MREWRKDKGTTKKGTERDKIPFPITSLANTLIPLEDHDNMDLIVTCQFWFCFQHLDRYGNKSCVEDAKHC